MVDNFLCISIFLILPGDKVNQLKYWVICSGSNLLVVINTNVLDHMSKVALVTYPLSGESKLKANLIKANDTSTLSHVRGVMKLTYESIKDGGQKEDPRSLVGRDLAWTRKVLRFLPTCIRVVLLGRV